MRRSFLLRASWGPLLGALSVAVPSVAEASYSYTLERLDQQYLYGYSQAKAINDSGQAVVLTVMDTAEKDGWGSYVWKNGQEQHLYNGVAESINDKGWIGVVYDTAMIRKPDGTVETLPVPSNLHEDFGVLSLNDSNQAVGYGTDFSPGDLHVDALYWDQGKLHDLGTFGGNQAQAIHINSHGEILVNVYHKDGEYDGSVWNSGNSTPIQVPGKSVTVHDLNDSGEVVGTISNKNDYDDTNEIGFTWLNGVMHDLQPLAGDQETSATGINDKGQIVGTSWADGKSPTPVMWEDGKVIDLVPKIAGMSGWSALEPTAINNNGLIAGEGILNGLLFANGVGPQQRAFLLQPNPSATAIPLPAGVWLGLSGVPLFYWRLRRASCRRAA